MKFFHFNIFRHRRRNAVILLVGIAAGCLVILAWKDNFSTHSLSSNRQQKLPFTQLNNKRSPSAKVKNFSLRTIAFDNQKLGYHFRVTNASSAVQNSVPRYSFLKRNNDLKPEWNRELYYNMSTTPQQFLIWRKQKQNFCDGRIAGYDHEFLEAKDMIIDKKFCICELQGGELIESVINQAEDAEYYKYEMGCFQVTCNQRPSYYFNGENHLTKWIYSLGTHNMVEDTDEVVSDFTIAITRYEYANLFHTMTDWYNAFLVMQFFNHTSFNTNILIIDAHPFGSLDSVWNQLFNSTVRLVGLPARTKFKHLAWGILGYNSLMKIYVSPTPPLIEDFRNFFLSAYNLDKERQIDCKRLNILFIWRHNYVAHPRNPTGFVSRKIRNEEQLIRYTKKKKVPTATLR